jgi:hypothetical protein
MNLVVGSIDSQRKPQTITIFLCVYQLIEAWVVEGMGWEYYCVCMSSVTVEVGSSVFTTFYEGDSINQPPHKKGRYKDHLSFPPLSLAMSNIV